jgi:hypothetical protein
MPPLCAAHTRPTPGQPAASGEGLGPSAPPRPGASPAAGTAAGSHQRRGVSSSCNTCGSSQHKTGNEGDQCFEGRQQCEGWSWCRLMPTQYLAIGTTQSLYTHILLLLGLGAGGWTSRLPYWYGKTAWHDLRLPLAATAPGPLRWLPTQLSMARPQQRQPPCSPCPGGPGRRRPTCLRCAPC